MEAHPQAARRVAERAILFADIAGSSGLYVRLGDVAARGLVADCVAVMAAVVNRNGGRVIKTIGDEVMATFPSAPAALLAASDL